MSTNQGYGVLVDEPRWLNEQEASAWRGYRRMRVLLDLQLARDLMGDSGLSEADYDVLSTLSETTGHRLRLSELAAHLLWSTSRLSHHITRMRQRGLVTREECADDARGSVIALTHDGLRVTDAAAPPHVASVRRHLIDLLTDDEVAALDALTHRVVDHLAHLDNPPAADTSKASGKRMNVRARDRYGEAFDMAGAPRLSGTNSDPGPS